MWKVAEILVDHDVRDLVGYRCDGVKQLSVRRTGTETPRNCDNVKFLRHGLSQLSGKPTGFGKNAMLHNRVLSVTVTWSSGSAGPLPAIDAMLNFDNIP